MDPKTPPPNQPGSAAPESAQIGAGLQESRLNTEFIDFLKKYGGYAVYGILAIVVAYAGWGYIQDQQVARLDRAFADLDGATDSVAVLLTVAEENAGHGAVAQLAKLRAAETMLKDARVGIAGFEGPASILTLTQDDYLPAKERTEKIEQARRLLDEVRQSVGGNPAQKPLQLRAIWGVATAQLSLRQFDEAEQTLQRFVEFARQGEIEALAVVGEQRLESLGALRRVQPIPVVLPDLAAVPGLAPTAPPVPSVAPTGPAGSDDGVFSPIDTAELDEPDEPEAPADPQQPPADSIGPPDPSDDP